MKIFFYIAITLLLFQKHNLSGHCQIPCGIYHDSMVYDQIDQYVETMYKAVSEISAIPFDKSAKDRNQLVRWVIEKENASDEATNILTVYFLQQKIKPDEEDTVKKLISAHKLLFLIVQIKQNTDRKIVFEFMEEWTNFKLMFHRENYECRIEEAKIKKWREEHEAIKNEEEKSNEQTKKP